MRTLLLVAASATLPVSMALAQATPAPCFESSLGTNLGMSDDQVAPNNVLGFTFPGPAGPVTAIDISSNGFVWLGSNPNDGCCFGYLTGPGGFLTDTPRIAPLWMDLNPSANGGVFFNTFPATGTSPARAVITWDQVPEYGGSTPFTVQLQLVADGSIVFWYDHNVSNVWHDVVIGVTEGVAAVANAVDLSTVSITNPHNSGTNPTVHDFQIAAFDLAATSLEFLPNSQGGYLVFDRPTCAPASARPFGRGCPQPAVVYELFTFSNQIDLSNTSIDFIATGSGYLALPSTAGFFTGFSGIVPSGDDQVTDRTLPFPFAFPGGSTNTIGISSNGFVWLAGGQFDSRCCAGDAFRFLNDLPSIAVLWEDLNPTQGGNIFYDVDTANSAVHVTWSAVPEYFNTGANTAQISLFASGSFRLSWQSVANVNADCLVGFSQGNGAFDPGSIDLGASLPLTTGAGGAPLTLLAQSGSRPLLGGPFTMELTNVASGSSFGIMLFGFGQMIPPFDLGVLGMPGCFRHVTLDVSLFFGLAGTPPTFSLNVPNNPALNGFAVYAQAATLTPAANPFGALSSNGVTLRLGL